MFLFSVNFTCPRESVMIAIRVNSGEDSPIELVPHCSYVRVVARQQLIYEVGRRGWSNPFSCVNPYNYKKVNEKKKGQKKYFYIVF